MSDEKPAGGERSSAEDEVDPIPFFGRCDELADHWSDLRRHAQRTGNKANVADLVVRIAGFAFAAAAAAVSTLVAAEVDGDLLAPTTSAILAALAAVATGIQASGMFRSRARHHYERMDVYRAVVHRARNLRAQVESRSTTVGVGYQRLDELIHEAASRPEMP